MNDLKVTSDVSNRSKPYISEKDSAY